VSSCAIFVSAALAVGNASAEGPLDDAEAVVFHEGQDGVDELAGLGVLDDAADNAGIEIDELVEGLVTDDSMFVTSELMVGYVEDAVSVPAGDSSTTGHAASEHEISAAAAASFAGDVFSLSSRPGSPRTIFLDLDGHTTVGTSWNTDMGLAQIVSAPYDVGGTPGVFSDLERNNIFEIWRRVADDFAPFDVNVTTVDPGVDGLRRTSAGDQAFGQRVVITTSNWYAAAFGSWIGGIAYVGVFSSNADLPAFVFSNQTAAGAPWAVADVASHEAGHTFGLRHDGQATSAGINEYYRGHNGWSPIMGTAPSDRITQWSRGEYEGATQTQDDLAMIAGHTGVIADDVAHAATGAPTIGSSSSVEGRLTAASDVDSFNVDVAAGAFSVTLRPTLTNSNLYAGFSVVDAAGTTVLTATPDRLSDWTATASGSLPAGRYTVRVSPASYLSLWSGFGPYGSLGVYHLTVNAGAGTPLPMPVNTPSAVATTAAPGAGSLFTAVSPVRLLDTRSPIEGAARLAANSIVRVDVGGRGGVAADAVAAVLNVVAVRPSSPGYLTVFPCGPTVPDVSVLNFGAAQTVANSTIATLDASGDVCVFSAADTDVIVDVTGWLGPTGGSRLQQIGPVRAVDTRVGVGGSLRLAAGSTTTFDLGGFVPAATSAVAINLTAVAPGQAGFVTAFPCDAGRPDTSSVNFAQGETRPNNAIVAISQGRYLCVFSDTTTDLLIDVTAAMNPMGLSYLPATPTRLIDTRQLAPVPANGVARYGVQAAALGDRSARAASVNVAVVNHPTQGFTTTFDCATRRDTSTLNQVAGQASANGAVVPIGSAGASCVFSDTGGDVIADLTGWWID
jgi:hypothetical protein